MTDWSPTGAPYAISERASASAELERAYRRLVGLYPRSFRRGNTEEIIAVLLATARAALARRGLSGCPRTVLYAVRLMYLGALAQAVELVALVSSASAIQAAARAN